MHDVVDFLHYLHVHFQALSVFLHWILWNRAVFKISVGIPKNERTVSHPETRVQPANNIKKNFDAFISGKGNKNVR